MAKTVPVEVTVCWNAAHLSAALQQISRELWGMIDPGCNDDCCAPKRKLARIADAALAEPARNVDKLETKEAALAALKERFPVEENFAGFEMAVEWLLDTTDFCLAWPVSHRFGTTAQKGGAE